MLLTLFGKLFDKLIKAVNLFLLFLILSIRVIPQLLQVNQFLLFELGYLYFKSLYSRNVLSIHSVYSLPMFRLLLNQFLSVTLLINLIFPILPFDLFI